MTLEELKSRLTRTEQERDLYRKVLESHVEWFNGVMSHQNRLLNKSLGEAIENWDEATNIEPLDFTAAIEALHQGEKIRKGSEG